MARYRKKSSDPSPGEILGGILVFMFLASFLLKNLNVIIQSIAALVFIATLLGILYFLYKTCFMINKPEVHLVRRPPVRSAQLQAVTPASQSDDTWRTSIAVSGSQQQQVFTADSYSPHEAQAWNETILSKIEWKQFERVCTEYYRMIGFNARETNIGADGGVDIRLYEKDGEFAGKPLAIIQCKAWNTYKVGVKLVRELFGIMAAEQVENGILITSGEFTSEASEFAAGKKIELISGPHFYRLILTLPEAGRQKLLEVALEGDYATPTCPSCDLKMVLRTKGNGGPQGEKFWGCVRYPRCRQTFKFAERVA